VKKEGASAKTKFFKPQTRKSFITYAMVIVAFVVMQILSIGGYISSMLTGLLVPLCVYSILAVSLNLTVGILGELSLGRQALSALAHIQVRYFLSLLLKLLKMCGSDFLWLSL